MTVMFLCGAYVVMALENLIANERPAWLAWLCRVPLGIHYRVPLSPAPVESGHGEYRASARDAHPWRNLPTLTIEGARIDSIAGTDRFVVAPTSWRSVHLTRVELVCENSMVDFRAYYAPTPLTAVPLAALGIAVLGEWGVSTIGQLSLFVGLIVGAPVLFLWARIDAMEHGRLAMERLGDALRAPTSEWRAGDVAPSRWLGRVQSASMLVAIPASMSGAAPGAERGPHATVPWTHRLEWYVDAAVRREQDLTERGLAYAPTIHWGLARLDDDALLAQRTTEVEMARRSTPMCTALADGVIDPVVFLPQLSLAGEDALRSWNARMDAAIRHERDGTGALLPADPDAVVEETFGRTLASMPEDEAAQILAHLPLDRAASAEARCSTYLAQEMLLSELALEERAAVLRSMHVIAARRASADP